MAMKKEWLPQLAHCKLFRGISETTLSQLLSCLSPKHAIYKKNEWIAIEYEPFFGLGIVLFGEVAVVKETFKGGITILAHFKEGDLFGEMVAFSDTGVWPSSVLAQTDCEVLFIRAEEFLGFCSKLCESHRVLLTNITRILAQKALLLNKKVSYLTIKSIQGKLAKYLLEQKKTHNSLTFSLPLNRQALSHFLNVSRPSMSRELCKLRDEGILAFYKESIKILDLEKLHALAEDA
jgi:CRP/FNR family transcriptional regulator, dissimilatory nitrate respiration regulator